jgi:hypothetical protein
LIPDTDAGLVEFFLDTDARKIEIQEFLSPTPRPIVRTESREVLWIRFHQPLIS